MWRTRLALVVAAAAASPPACRAGLGSFQVNISHGAFDNAIVPVQFLKVRSKSFPVEERVDVGADGAIEGIPHDVDAEPSRPLRARGQAPCRGLAAFGPLEDFVRVLFFRFLSW